MKQYIIRRLLQMIPILLGVTLIIFLIYQATPGDIVSDMKRDNPKMSVQKEQQLRHLYHLDKPVLVQYGYWLKDAMRMEFGTSTKFKVPVKHIINEYIWNSFLLAIFVSIVSMILAVIIGVVSAVKQYSVFDMVFTVLAFAGFSIPSFFIGLLLIKAFSLDLKIFPTAGMITTGSNYTGWRHFADVAYHMFLPFITLTIISIGGTMRYARTSMLEVVKQDYIRTARSKGLSEKVVIYRHALKNALIPIVTLIGFSLSGLFAGSMITEQVFTWPGIGKIALDCINARDYNVVMAYTVLMAFLTLIGNLIADILYAVVDPRIRLS
jgi:peptide/nickel transport system permease protein